MDYYCEVCLENIKAKRTYNHFKSKAYQQLNKFKHIISSYKDIDTNDVGEAFYLYIIEHNIKFDYFLIKCEYKLVFNDYEYSHSPYVMCNVSDNKTMISWKNF